MTERFQLQIKFSRRITFDSVIYNNKFKKNI